MNFITWLEKYECVFWENIVSEVLDVYATDVKDVMLHPYMQSYEYNFDFEREFFTVMFLKRYEQMPNIGIPQITGYEIMFRGPSFFAVANKFGAKANKIYTQVLIATRKLIEITQNTNHPAHFLSWSPAEPKMAILYDKFYERFLKDKYVRIDTHTIVDRMVLEAHKDLMHPLQQQNLQNQLDLAYSQHQKNLEQAKKIQSSNAEKRRKGISVDSKPSKK